MKRFAAILLTLVLTLQLVACQTASNLFQQEGGEAESTQEVQVDDSGLKVGFLFPSGSDAPDTVSRVEGIRKMQMETGLSDSQVLIRKNVSKDKYEDEINTLVDKGCTMIIAKSAEGEKAMLEAAKQYPEVQFCQEDGTKAQKSGLSNYHNFYTRMYEAYYVAGVAAGMKLNHMLNNGDVSAYNCVIGFVASRENPENISCINAFYLGVEEVCSQAEMMVRYVGSKGVYDDDGKAARQLVAAGVCLMAQRTFTTAVAAVCAENDIPVVGSETNVINTAPDEAITSATADWSVYYTYAVKCMENGEKIDTDWCGGYKEKAVTLTQLNDRKLVDGTIERLQEIERSLRNGTCKIFDTEKFTVNGESLTNLAENSENFKKYKKYISDGEFQESVKRSAPVMEFLIDGISESTENYLPEDEASEASTEDGTIPEGTTAEE